jgi:hypothetical protein
MSILTYLSVIEGDSLDFDNNKRAANWKKLLQLSTILFVVSSVLNLHFFMMMSSCSLFYLSCSFSYELGKEHVILKSYKKVRPHTLISIWPKD